MSSKLAPLLSVAVLPGVEFPQAGPEALIPHHQSDDAAGVDLYAVRAFNDPVLRADSGFKDFPVSIEPGEAVMFGTGIVIAIPPDFFGDVRPRSGLASRGINLSNTPGTIDSDYRGEVGVLLRNYSSKPYSVNRYDRIAQCILQQYVRTEFRLVESVDQLPETRRGTGGFGSTGISGSGLGTAGHDAELHLQDLYFMSIVITTAGKSSCVRGCKIDGRNGHAIRDGHGHLVGQTRRYGCVFARDNTILSTGYNCQYPGSDPCEIIGCLRTAEGIPSGQQFEKCRAIHAEEMAILNAANFGIALTDSTMYCNAEPCILCAKSIAALGIKALCVLGGGYSSPEGLEIVQDAGIPVRIISKDDLRACFLSNMDVFA